MVFLEAHATIGAAGAVTKVEGGGIADVEKIATGTYQITLKDAYYRLLGLSSSTTAPKTGADVASASLVASTVYEITAVGTTDWHEAGLPAGQTAAVGQVLVASGTPAGTGTAKEIAAASAVALQIVGDPNVMINQATPTIVLQAVDDTGTVVDLDNGSKLHLEICLRNSTRTPNGQSE